MSTMLRAISTPIPSAVEKARELQRQAEAASQAIANEVLTDLKAMAMRCAEASELTAVHPGVRDLLRRQAESITIALNTVASIRGRE